MPDEEDLQRAGTSGGVMGRGKSLLNKLKNIGFMGLLKDNPVTLKNLLVSGVTVGLELLLSTEVFDCPVKHHKAYGTAFLVTPVFIVFFANLVILGEVSMLTDRCCIGKYRRWGDCFARVLPGIIKALFGPFFWLIASFADTTYFVCSQVGQAIEKRNLTNETEIKILQEKFVEAKSESHVIAWVLFAILVFVTATVIISGRCTLKDDHLSEDRFSLERREAVAAMIAFHKRAGDLDEEKRVKKETKTNTNDGETGSNPKPSTREADSGEDKDETRRLLEEYEEITLYPDGAPEKFAQKRVEELFENWSKDKDWHYVKAYKKLTGMYPRVTCGKPWVPWVSDSLIKKGNVLKQVV